MPPAQIEDAQAAESITQTVFTLPYKVSVTAGQSLVLPILDRGLPATRIDLYQSSVDQHHPLAAIALANDGETGLPPGVLTLYVTALSRLASYHSDGRRRLNIESHGSGKRLVRIGYVVSVPLWKASYRLSLPGDPRADRARLQGWAILENFSGQPWHDVSLTLLSGNPVTFRQSLFESYYVTRPNVPVEVAGRVLPKLDTGSIGAELAAAPSPAPQQKALAMARSAAEAVPAPPPPASAPAQIETAQAAESVTQIVFALPYKVSVAAGQSLVLPILDRELPAQRIDVYQSSADQRHTLAAIALNNDGETGLPPGVLTLYEQATAAGATYLGDARLAAFPPGETRMLS